MGHNPRIWTDAQLVDGLLPTGQNFRDLDEETYEAINGDAGGLWAPSAPIIIAGTQPMIAASGWLLGSSSSCASDFDAPILFAKGTRDDVFGIPGGAPRTLTAPVEFVTYYTSFDEQFNAANQVLMPGFHFVYPCPTYDDAVITSASFVVFVATHSGVPPTMPRLRIMRVDANGNAVSLRAPASDTDANGYYVIPTPASGAAWTAGGAAQTFTVGCNQNNAVDTSKYQYFFDVYDETGFFGPAAVGNAWTGGTVTFSSIALLTGQE